MDDDLVQMSVELWVKKPGLMDSETAENNARKWQAAVNYLGDKWILAKNIQRIENPPVPVLNSVRGQ
jgi:hypothetical protein